MTHPAVHTLVDLLRSRASSAPATGYTFLVDGESQEAKLGYAELDRWARAIAVRLQALGAAGERVLILYPPGLDYVAAFFGCLYAGAVAVPAYPPDPSRLARTLPRLQAIVKDAQAKFALTTGQILSFGPMLFGQAPDLAALTWLGTDDLVAGGEPEQWRPPAADPRTLAFLQYTSGSTGDPKGVMLTHGNLLANERMITQGFGVTSSDIVAGWLPLYHDMGLIGNLLQPLYLGVPCVLMSPIAFLTRPLRWLQMISTYRATTSGGPNFAFDLCVRKVSDEERSKLDLSSWSVAFTGAEPVRPETLDRFAERFAPCGFDRRAYYPCYGLAEATLLVSGGKRDALPVINAIDPAELERHRAVTRPVGEGRTIVGCGRHILDDEIVIVDPETRTRVGGERVGEIWVSGPHIAQGYWNRPDLSAETFAAHLASGEGPFLRTGDFGFVDRGELYITGRLKDLIIIRGRNHYPQDIELTVERSHPAVRPGCSAAFSVDVDGEERLVVVCELDAKQVASPDAVIEQVRQAVSEAHEVAVHAVALAKGGAVPKTSSGKIQRRACKAAFIAEQLEVVRVLRVHAEESAPAPVASAATAGPAAPTPFESEVATVVARKLGVPRDSIDITAPVTRYGIDSLGAVELVDELERTFGVALEMQALLAGPTIREVAAALGTQKPAATQVGGKEANEHALSFGQQALWVLHQLAPDSPAYNIATALRVRNELDVDALRRSFQRIVLRHAALRTTFPTRDGKPFAKVASYKDVDFALIEGSSWSTSELQQRLVGEANRAFDLAKGPLLRVRVITHPDGPVMLIAVHHIVVDMWSLVILGDELGVIYREETGGDEAALAPPRMQYADQVRAEQSLLASERGEARAAYWTERLAGTLPVLDLPVDRARPPVQTYRGATRRILIPPALAETLKAVGKQQGATLYMTLLAAYYVTLHRHTGQTDIIVGAPTRGRSRPELRDTIGYFVNPIPLRADVTPSQTFAELLVQVRRAALSGFANSDYPFFAMVNRIAPSRDARHSPIFQTQFVFQKAQGDEAAGMTALAMGQPGVVARVGALSLEAFPLDQGIAQFDLSLYAGETANGLAATFEYNSDLFDDETIDRLIEHYQVLLGEIAADSQRRIGDLPLLTAREREQLLVEWNATELAYPADKTVHDLLDAQVDRTPDAVALQFEGAQLTYREVDQRANQLAHRLRELGVGPDTLVSIFCERSPEMAIAMIAVHKAGGAYVPLDPNYPKERIELIQEDSACAVMLTQERLVDRLPSNLATIIRLDADWPSIARLPSTRPPRTASASSLSHIIYTSGSTGRPKGVAIEHHSVVSFCFWAKQAFTDAQRDGVLFSTSICFDLSVYELFATLAWGGRVVLVENALALLSLPPDANVRLVNSVPSIIATVLKSGVLPASVETVNLAGEPLKNELVERLYQIGTVRDVFDLYGPSETTTYSTYTRRVAGGHYTIGRPLANTQVYLVDQNRQLVPRGVAGEICIGGAGVARGYLGRPELTAEKFIELPFARGRVYRTGDLGRWLSDGTLEYVGRIDHQVKIRGFRIELGEIEAALLSQGSLREAVVLAREDVPGDKRLVAYVVGRGAAPDIDALRAELRTKLPDYMVPAAFVVLDEMPLTPNGKIDRKALPAPDASGASSRVFVAPRTAEEQSLAEIWREVLHLERIGIDDNFFDLGGHSLLATQVASRVRQTLGIELALRSLFETPTVRELARSIESTRRAAMPPIDRVTREGALELSFAQQRLWFLDQLEPNSAFYNVSGTARLSGTLDTAALVRALQAIVARHESLRTTFETRDGRPVQVITPSLTLDVPIEDVGSADQAHDIALADAKRPFDIARGPLIRARILRLAADEHWLLLSMHHIISDGWSLGVLMQEMTTLYAGGELPPLTVQYADFSAWQRTWLAAGVLEQQLGYWKRQLAGIPSVLEIPTDRPRPPVISYRGATQSFQLPAGLVDALDALGREQSATLFMTLLAAFQTLLHRYSRQDDIAVGSPVANRNRAETEGLIGFFVNTVVLRTDLSGNPSFRDLLARVRETSLGAYAHQDVPFEKLVEELSPERNMRHSPLFQVMFVLQNTPVVRALPGLQQSLVALDTGTAKFDITLVLEPNGQGLAGSFEYNTDLFDPSTIERMVGHYQRLLEAIAADASRPIGSLPILTEREHAQVVVEWNDTARPFPDSKTTHELFEAQVDRTPDAIAVVFGSQQLSYRELDRRANRLAHHLRSLGVGPDALVGVCVERSLDMVVGLLGVMKAGGAYLPLDPGYPAERLTFMMEDAALAVVVTQSHLVESLPRHQARVVRLDVDSLGAESDARVASGATPESVAYVEFTSGSTGRPKGVVVPHRAIARLVFNTNYIEISPSDVFLQLSPIAFDASTLELWGPLLNGGTLVVFPPHTPSLDELGRAIVDHGVTVLWLTSGLFHQMVDQQLMDLAGVRCVLSGGDVLSVSHVRRVVEQLPGTTMINAYGPTENTTFTTCFQVPRTHEFGTSIPIGRPISNTTVYVLDPSGQPVPIGVPGELYTGGAGLARGYLHREELTAERFVPNTFGPDRLYRTGDLVRWLPDGTIEFLGRIDQQVKVRGFRIELGEIESVLAGMPGVREAVVIVREDIPGDKRVVAYLVGSDIAAAQDLRAQLKDKLPDYMVPSAFVTLETLPLNPNGKVDRKALPVPDASVGRESTYVAPRTKTEQLLAEIWQEVLRVARVGIEDNFFELGGHSLLATQVVSRVRHAFAIELRLRALFEAPTISELARAIDAQQTTTVTSIKPAARDRELPLSFAQQRLWFLDQLQPNSALYTIAAGARLTGPLDVAALGRSLNAIVARHEALRTTFTVRGDSPVQVIAPVLEIPLDVEDAASDEQAKLLATDATRRPFDLSRGPLFRALLIRRRHDVHWLVLTIHHVVADGWSMSVLMEELAALYAGAQLPPLAIQYADFSVWQREWLSGGVLDAQLAYWRTQLIGAPELLELPTDRPRPAVMSYRGTTKTFELSPKLRDALEALAREQSATLFMTLLAAFQTLLHRYSRQDDITVGSPVANRNRAETERLIGFFVNTLVMRTDLSGNPTFTELLARVREVALGAYAHQDVPFEKLVEELRPGRNLSHTPLFQVMFVLQNTPASQSIPGLDQRAIDLDSGTSKFDLTLALDGAATGLAGSFEYNSDIFDASTIDRMIAHFEVLLESIVADPGRRIGELGLLTEQERRRVLVEWNATAKSYPTAPCIHELFEAQVDRTPDSVALTYETEHLTYRELDRRANQLAHRLRRIGVGPDVRVGVCAERSLEMVIALFAVLKAGGAYVPLDPAYPRERLEFMIEDASVPVLLTQDRLLAKLPTHDAQVILLDADWADISGESDGRLANSAKATHLAYVIFTSGSTGRPKGAMNEHRGVVNRLLWMQDAYRLDASDRVLQKTPFSFDVSVWEFFWPLITGARLVVARPGGHQDPDYLVRVIREQQVTTVHFVPSMLSAFLQASGVEDCTTLRRVVTSGEALSAQQVERFFTRSQAALYNLYGPTEAAVDVTHWTAHRGAAVVPIGRPIANLMIYILDAHGSPVPIGVAGELFIGGIGVGRGYLNRPDLTAEKFIANPYGSGTLYRTGDLCRWMPDGNIEYLGRIDFQVKLRGFRIELGEIEAALAQHPSTRDVAVLARQDVPGDMRLVAYVVGRSGRSDATELRSWLAARLPEYMVPSAFVMLDELPLSPNGKIDRKALPAPSWGAGTERVYVAPRSATEQIIAGIWSDLLHVEKVGMLDNFFELGGHSLLATQVASRVRQAFGVELPLRSFFESADVAALAQAVEAASRRVAPPIVPVTRDGDLELSFAQQRLWFLDQLEPNSSFYNVPTAIKLRGALDVSRLRSSLARIVERHEALRTTFPTVDGEPRQVIAPTLDIELPVIEVSSSERAQELVMAEAAEPFDLARGPLVRAKLLRLDAAEHWLLLTLHHIDSDGWSLGILLDELATLYDGGELPPLPIQYADFAAWQRAWLTGDVLDEQLAYWKRQLDGMPSLLEMPTDRPRPAVLSYRGATYTFPLRPGLREALEAFSRQQSVTMFMTLFAAFLTLLHRYSRQEDIAVGSPVANRNRAETEGLIGFFVNTLVLRTDLSGNPTFHELLARVREVSLAAYSHQDVPFEKLVEELHPARNLSYSPLFQVMFTAQESRSRELPGLQQSVIELDTASSKFDLTLGVDQGAAGLVGQFEYSTDLFDSSTIERMAVHYQTLLEAILADASMPIGELALLTERERRQILVEWNDTEKAYPTDLCVHELFEAQVRERPDAIAVELGPTTLTYQDLDQRANQLAHHLIALGIGPEIRVGICVERSLEMVVGVLGILKAGGAYVPLDPDYPKDRLAFLLEDAAVPVLLTQDRLAGALEPFGPRLVRLDTDWPVIATQSVARPPLTATTENLAYVIYTSGSTGRPKGVQIEHRMVFNLVMAFGECEEMSPGDRSLQFSSIAFDGSVNEIFCPLAFGATMVLRGEDVPTAAELLGPRYPGVSIFNMATAYWHSLATAIESGDAPATPALRLVNMGGERALPERVVAWQHLAPSCMLQNLYGPAECTDIATVWRMRADQIQPGREVPIGGPLPNYTVFLLDARRQPVPVGVPGEIYIGGSGVARGYLNRPDLTAEKFVPNPFGPGRLYRTGDFARWFPDGNLEFIGRVDHQVKIRGYRIELGEIEAALGEHPSVKKVVVLAREDSPGDKRLVAYLVGREGPPDVDDVRTFLKAKLPDYMVPFAFISLDELPLTTNGKVDTRALPAPDMSAARERYVAPRTQSETVVAGIWADVLKLERVGVEDDFFDLGGHSLLATQVVSRVRQAFQVELPLRTMFEARTVADLATAIETARGDTAPPIEPVSRDGELELSYAQARLWFLDQLAPGSTFYNMPAALRLEGALDVASFTRALQTIVQRHESLRTTFASRDGRPVQIIADTAAFELPVIDVATREQAEVLAIEEAARPFDLTSGPLIRGCLLRLRADEHWLILTMHHIISDMWSQLVLIQELATLYRGGELPPLQIQYADFAVWQRRWLAGGALAEQLAYWKKQLVGAPAQLELPTDRPRPAVLSSRGAATTFRLSSALSRALTNIGRDESATLFMTMLAAFNTLLARYSRQEDIVVGTPVANRNRAETEPLIGFFVNTLVLRTDLSGNPTFRELLGRVREVALGAYGHQDVPFEKLVEELQPERSLARTPLFQVMFSLDTAQPSPELPGIVQSLVEIDVQTAKFDMSVVMEESPDGISGTIEYNTDLFDASTIERMIGHFEILLGGIAADPGRRVSELPMLTDGERQQLLDWNATALDYPTSKRVHDLFEEQVIRAPDAVAVVLDEQRLSFRELNRRANTIAHQLRALGVGPDVLVGICAERSLDMIGGLLGILKAGGAYVPLDPKYPSERLTDIVQDARPAVVLADAGGRRTLGSVCGSIPIVAVDDVVQGANADQNPRVEGLTSAHLVYVIYTSGSTGRPKGVAIEHRSLVNHITWQTGTFGFSARDAVLQRTSISFDASVWELWTPLAIGARLVLLPPDAERDPAWIARTIERQGVTVSQFVPTLLRLVVEQTDAPFSCDYIFSGGEPLDPTLAAAARGRARRGLVNLYGPTEATIDSTSWVCPDDAAATPATIPIGRPVANASAYVLDAAGQLVPIGAVGELHIGGVGVARGYLNRPELTAERFVPNPIGSGTLYRTGDLVRWLRDGTLEYLGRVDHQVKLRGFRIELGEIESVLAEHPSVRDVVVLVREDAPGDKRLVAYLVGRDATADVSVLRAHATEKLPEHMVPAVFVVLEEMPLTPNGKIDRKALPVPTSDREGERRAAPRTATELAVAQVFEHILGLRGIGAHDDFFALGGHSLLAVQLVSAIKAELKTTLPIAELFRTRTVESLARAIDGGAPAATSNLVPLRRDGDGVPVVFIHAIGGTVFRYLEIVRHLAAGRPCFAIQATGLADGEVPADRVVQMAGDYVELLGRDLGDRPFHLVGWSFGGVVALEIARQLATSKRVLSTTLLDSFAPVSRGEIDIDARTVIAAFARDLGLDVASEIKDMNRDAALAHVRARAIDAAALPAHIEQTDMSRFVAVFAANLAAEWHHRPDPFPGNVTMIAAANEPHADPSHGFADLVTGVLDLRLVPGDHDSILTAPDVLEVTRLLDQVMTGAEGPSRRG